MNQSITHLDVSKNELFEKGALLIVDALKTNWSVTSLAIANNDIAQQVGVGVG